MAFPTIRVEAAFVVPTSAGFVLDDPTQGVLDSDALSDAVWTDITDYARNFNTRRGATRAEGPTLRFEAATLQLTLDNSDRRFDPTNTASPYWSVAAGRSQVEPMRAVRIIAEIFGISYPIFYGYADDWDISYEGPSVSICGLTATDGTKVLNDYDRVALGSEVGEGELSGARVHRILDSVEWPIGMRDIDEGRSVLQGTTLDRTAWEELLLVQDSEIGQVFMDAEGQVVFRDRYANMFDPHSVEVQAEFGDERDLFFANGFGWTISNMSASVTDGILLGTSTTSDPIIQRTTSIPGQDANRVIVGMALTGGPAVQEAQLFFTSTLGGALSEANSIKFPVTSDGVFREYVVDVSSRWEAVGTVTTLRLDPTGNTGVTVEFRYIAVVGPASLPFVDHDIVNGHESLINVARIAVRGGAQQIAEDTTSRQQYLTHTHERTDLILIDDDDAGDYAAFVLAMCREPELRFDNLKVQGHDDEALWEHMLGRQFGDLISLTRRPPGGGPSVTREAYIVGVTHDVPGPNQWTTTWTLQPATRWTFMTLDDAMLGVLGAAALAF